MAVLWTAILCCAGPANSFASSLSAASDSAQTLAPASADWNDVHLRRAVSEQAAGNVRGVIENLEAIDDSAATPFPEADRAAFLLGQAYLEIGDRDRFIALAERAGHARVPTAYTRWLTYQLHLLQSEGGNGEIGANGIGSTAADALAADLLLRNGDAKAALQLLTAGSAAQDTSPVASYLRARALALTGGDDGPELVRLSTLDTTSALGRDLAGASLVLLANRALTRREDAMPLLERVPPDSRYASRAHHMMGLIALEKGDTDAGRRTLESVLTADSTYNDRREVAIALGGSALEAGQFEAAHDAYKSVDAEWALRRATLEGLLKRASYDSLWAAWRESESSSDALMLDALPAEMLALKLDQASLDLGQRPAIEVPAPIEATRARAMVEPVEPPSPEEWRSVAASQGALGEARSELERTRWELAREHEALDADRTYRGLGLERARHEEQELLAHAALLDSLKRTLDDVNRRLKGVHDESTKRILARTADVIESCAQNLRWLQAMRHFYIEGPNRARAFAPPAGFPSADSLTLAEIELTSSVDSLARRFAVEMPDLITRSYDQVWRPGLIDRAGLRSRATALDLAWTKRIESAIDSSIAASGSSATLRTLTARENALERHADSLAAADQALRASVAKTAVERAVASLDQEREAIDYGLATSSYALSVRNIHVDPLSAGAAGANPLPVHAAGDSSASDSAAERYDPVAAAWRTEAIGEHRTFLERYPQSPMRGEMRFRLADLLLVDARERFNEQMARFVQNPSAAPGARVALPTLEYRPALELYQSILANDPSFAHLDAVYFNAGSILADEGDGEAESFFQNLVDNFPDSHYTQEAWLRLGDLRTNDRRIDTGLSSYRRAAAGADPSLTAIALYKLGSAEFNQDDFVGAADAFRGVVDLYEQGHTVAINADIRHESETYLMHSLARAGGAKAFAAYFDSIGPRVYEKRLLLALGQHFRRYSLYSEAIATDTLFMSRYPTDGDALLSAKRLADTYRRLDKTEDAQQALLEVAPHFGPTSAWFNAQTSDSVRNAGEEFAKSSILSVALAHHLEARRTGSQDEWRSSLALVDTVIATWPKDPQVATLEMVAGEASTHLGEYPIALEHYAAAAKSGTDSVASVALWQRVAVTDAWYESTRGGTPGALGSDSLARAVMEAADRMLDRFPAHAQGSNAVWREGHLAFAHSWFDTAAVEFGRMATKYPNDSRAPVAASLKADALFRLGRFADAGQAYEDALGLAKSASLDTLATRDAAAIPVCYFREAEAAVAADSTNYAKHAALFETVASRWPDFKYAPLAQYRAGLAYIAAGKRSDGVLAMQALIRNFPKSEFVKDAYLQVAKTWEAAGDAAHAGEAYAAFAEHYPTDETAGAAWLKAADLYAAAGNGERADQIRLDYIRQHPNDVETVMDILAELAERDLKTVTSEHPISKLIGEPVAVRTIKTKHGTKSVAVKTASAKAPSSHLAAYLAMADLHPQFASKPLIAQVRFLQGEEARASFDLARLKQPLQKSLPAKQALLDKTIAAYRRCVDLGVAEWAHGAAFRMGETLVAFGEAVEKSERPADLSGNDLKAYEDVLYDQAQAFSSKGEGVWRDLLKQVAAAENAAGKSGTETTEDHWITQAREAMWGRLANKFYFRPEAEFPLLAASPVHWKRSDKERDAAAMESSGADHEDAPKPARRKVKGQ
jgi:TolA-binding protein